MFIKNMVLITTSLIFISACATAPKYGENVFITPSDSSHLVNCELLGQVEIDASVYWLWGVNEQVKEIKYRLRDEAARRYPNVDTVSHSDLNVNFFLGPDTNIMGTAFKCFR